MEAAKQQLLEQTYQTILKVGFGSNDYDLVADLISPNFVAFGTALDEKIFGHNDLKALLQRQKAQGEGLDINLNINNLYKHFSRDENTAVYIDEVILSIANDGENLDMLLRLSMVLEYIEDKWLMVHFHSSKPEEVESEKDTWGIETWKEKAEQLEKEVAERTADLVLKNRDLEIESALERVRSASMAMHKTEDIAEVVLVYFKQLKSLNIEFIQAWITIFQLEEEAVEVWFSPLKGIHNETQYFKMPSALFKDTSIKSWKNGEPFSYITFPTKSDMDSFMQVCDEVTNSNYFGIIQDKLKLEHFEMLDANHKYGCISKSNTKKASQEERDILQRFAKVFEQTYTRFLDLQKAEEQAREAKIEAALEKVRSTSMAMHKSTEMQEVANAVYEQMKSLGLEIHVIGMSGEIQPDSPYEVWVGGSTFTKPLQIPYTESTEIQRQYNKAIAERPELYQGTFSGKVKKEYIDFLISESDIPKPLKKLMQESSAKTTSISFSQNSSIQIVRYTEVPYSEEDNSILVRFAKVFNQAYIRFLDLKKAEAQTREAQIEASLERIRAKSMAMHHPGELSEVLTVMFEQLDGLGVKTAWTHLSLIDLEKNTFTYRMTGREGKRVEVEQVVAIDASDVWIHAAETFKSENPDAITRLEFKPNDLPKLWDIFDGIFSSLPEGYQIFPEDFPNGLFATQANCKFGYLGINQPRKATEEEEKILGRFGNEFGRLYQRYLDIEKAQLQARKAQIEASLERVRAKAMAMHQTDELTDVLGILFDQFEILGVNPALTHLTLFDEANDTFSLRITTSGKKRAIAEQIIDVDAIEAWRTSYENWKKSELHALDLIDYKAEDLPLLWEVLDEVMSALPEENKIYPKDFPNGLYTTQGHCKFGYLGLNSERKATKEEKDIVVKFAKEFGRLYQRFLDLQKAEAQAREAQIEAALEKVRSRTMAMQTSSELPEAANTLFLEVQALDIPAWSAGYCIWEDESKKSAWCNMSSEGEIQKGFSLPTIGEGYDFYNPLKTGETFYMDELGGKELVKHYEFMTTLPIVGDIFKDFDAKGIALPTFQIFHIVYFEYGYVMFITYEAVPQSHSVFKRFGKVFEQTYTRFLDLKRAEAQAREAQIETALERVRSQSMGMQSTDDFGAVTTEMFNQLRNFGEELFATGIVFCDKHEGHVEQWHSIPGAGMVSPFIVPIDLDYIHKYRYDQWKKGEELFSIEIPGDFIEQHFEDIFKLPSAQVALKDLESRNAPMPEAPPWEIDYGASFEHGYVLISSLKPLENTDILLRFTKVFEQAYTRFLDLKRAEAQAREAQIEAALEKVRSQSLSMQQPNELNGVVQLIAEKLQELDVILDLGGVVICTYFPDSKDVLHWIATPDSESSGKFLLPYFDHVILKEAWASKNKGDQWFSKVYSIEEKNSFFEHAFEHSDYKHFPEAAKKDILKRKHHTLSFAWSKHSALLIPSYSGLMPSETERDILIRFAKVFEHAYIRFMDLQEKEEQAKALFKEKQRLEETLSDLQTTQKQLIQSEKMASLGELTAGIAHEIQNPLNFVNNFSEVSKELLEEMLVEIENGNMDEVKAIMDDVMQNLEKINHHGQRADGIVKGMLQHSRASGDKKEATDINALADEYLRLAYHGLRAKDKSFNAQLVTDFDTELNKVKVIPQDLGRVILNLLTNAFYVVNEKKKSGIEGYEPTVSISTQKKKDHLEIKVTDNGNGMPAAVKEKIFQPFFTTKPTGQGTGLGLSMSYDIISKGHGGELKVESTEGEGTSFIIKLPTK